MNQWYRVLLFAFLVVFAVGCTASPSINNQNDMADPKMEEPVMEENKDTEMQEDEMMEKPTATHEVMMEEPAEISEEMMDEEGEMMEAPGWFSADLVDVRSGESFRLADYKGKVVLVETFAVWCSTCLRQQNEVKALHEALGMLDDFVSIGLDIDPNEDAEKVKNYINEKGFDWQYAVATPAVANEIGNLYGSQFLNPPSAPILLIDREGNVTPLPFGVKSVEDLKEAVEPLLKGDM